MPGDFRCDRCEYSCAFELPTSHTRLRVHWAPGIPHALFGAQETCTIRAHRAARRRLASGRQISLCDAQNYKITPAKRAMAIRPASLYWSAGTARQGQGCSTLSKNLSGGNMRKLVLAAASVAALALAGPVAAQSPIVIKFSHVVASNTPKGAAAEKFKELAEKYTDGKVKVEVYPNSTLYKDKEELEALQLGAVQMLAPSNSKFGPIGVREFEVFDLPYILPDLATLRKVTDGPLGAKLLKLLEPKGMTGLAYWDNGFKEMTANKKLVTPQDYKGVKFRIQSSKVLEAQFRALGSIPQVMAFGEVYQALQTGVVDGQENTWSNIYTQKMHEVQKYATVTNHGYIGYVVVTNKQFWDGLPADIRTQLEKAVRESTAFGNGQSAKENEDALAAIKNASKTGIVTLTPDHDAAMAKAMNPAYKDAAPRVGQPLIDEFIKETGGATH